MNLCHRLCCNRTAGRRKPKAEAFRLLRPGEVFAGSDSVTSLPFRILHFRRTCNLVTPQVLPDRLRAVRFHDVDVEGRRGEQCWRAVKP